MSRKISMLLLICTLAALLAGCYDNNEIDTLADVTAVGVREAVDGTEYIFAIADMGSFDSSGDNGSKSGTVCYSANSDSPEEAVEEINAKLSKKLSFSHMSIIIFSKRYAENGVGEIAEYFENLPGTRPQTLAAICGENPSKLLENLSPRLEVNLEKYFLNMLLKSETYIPILRLCDLTDALLADEDVLAPVISAGGDDDDLTEKDVSAGKAAVISGGKYRLELADSAAAGLINSEKNVSVDLEGKKYILHSTKPPIVKIRNSDSETSVNIELFLECKNSDSPNMKQLRSLLEKELSEASEMGYDICGYARKLKKSFLFWQTYEKFDWRSRITRAEYNVKISGIGA